jgi:formylglycine-generating enzyme required for sulfatase activity
MTDIFISYANEDIDRVEPLAKALESQGWSVFWDRKIPPGKTWDDIIEEAIEAAKCIIVVWTKESVNSGWVRAEAQEGLDRGILVPVKFGDVKIPLRFRPVQAANFIGWEENTSNTGFKNLWDAITDILGSPPVEEEERKHNETEARLRAEEERKKEEAEAKRKTDEERKRQEVKTEIKKDKPKPDAKGITQAKSSKPRKTSNAVKFSAVAGVIVLLILGILLYISKQKEVETRPGHVFRDKLKDGSEGPEMIILAGGNFLMGSPDTERYREDNEGPQHSVTISQPFALSIHEITFAEYNIFAKDTGQQIPDDGGWGRGDRPVINVSWEDATAYAQWLSEQTGQDYRLPTEAEWEYAARAGSTTAYSFGDDPSRLDVYAWFDSNSGKKTHPVGQKQPNDWGLYDMYGNVWEWCQDRYGEYPSSPVTDPMRTGEGTTRMLRGGSWRSGARSCRSANRRYFWPDDRSNLIFGFRLSRSVAFGS